MLKNQQGSALVLVLLMTVVLSVLALSLIASTINETKQTVTREQDIMSIHDAQRALDEGIARIKVEFDYGTDYVSPSQHELNVTDFARSCNDDIESVFTLNNEENGFQYSICDNTPDTIDRERNLSRVFQIKALGYDSSGINREFSQTVYLSAIPSFLYYALGSRDTLIINGSPTITGNIYAKNDIKINREAKYFIPELMAVVTKYPFISNKNDLQEDITANVIIESSKNIYFDNMVSENILDAFDEGSKAQYGEPDIFNDVNIRKTFVDKLNEKILSDMLSESHLINPSTTFNYLIQTHTDKFYEIQHVEDVDSNSLRSPIYNGGDTFTIENNNLIINQSEWLIINGDLFIQSSDELIISGNILVTGDVIIRGSGLKFDSSILSLGSALIIDAEISQLEDNASTLILFASKGLEVTRINEFDNDFNNNEKIINAFLYTDSEVSINNKKDNECNSYGDCTEILYGVGSRVMIEGGVFAKGDLTVNAVRGDVFGNSISGKIEHIQDQNSLTKEQSRFVVKHNRSIITMENPGSKAYYGLPRTERFSIIADRREIN